MRESFTNITTMKIALLVAAATLTLTGQLGESAREIFCRDFDGAGFPPGPPGSGRRLKVPCQLRYCSNQTHRMVPITCTSPRAPTCIVGENDGLFPHCCKNIPRCSKEYIDKMRQEAYLLELKHKQHAK
ncbi:hypothetical protein V5799_011958 [Amblyomma americanum]|uniref:Secreted protein n=1 Tax=Amblyomma americanum TaxID=6943 RepID=A0AAQ4EFE8_AMBAM